MFVRLFALYIHTNFILVPKGLFREYKKKEKKILSDNIIKSKIEKE